MTENRDMRERFIEYIRQYIRALTAGREEFFLSLCDLEEEPLRILRETVFEQYTVVIVDQKDYSEAVRMRNDRRKRRIVLFSGEGVKQIDSLKDFHEYSVTGEDRGLFWQCMRTAFSLRMSKMVTDFLDAILDESEASFWDFFKYFYEGTESGKPDIVSFNQNLPALGIWKSNETKALTKGKIRRMIRASKDDVMERRLAKALTENRLRKREETCISNNLARGDFQAIREKVFYESVEEQLKGTSRGGDGEASVPGAASEEREPELCSYACLLRERSGIPVEELEEIWQRERQDRDEAEDGSEDEAESEFDWGQYEDTGSAGLYQEQLGSLRKKAEGMNVPKEAIDRLLKKLSVFEEAFLEACPKVTKLTPICLYQFCQEALPYTQAYFEVLSCALTDSMIRKELLKSGIVSELECLFCRVEKEKISLPFYHPVCVFYYIELKKMYEFAVEQEAEEGLEAITAQTLQALIKKLGMRFPVKFLRVEERLYALDYTTVWNRGTVEFTSTGGEVVYSALDLQMVEKQIIDYLIKHSLETEITVVLVEISDLNGLVQLVDKIRQISGTERCNIGRVVFRILSSKEEELKKQLSGMWDMIGTDEIVRFRFGTNAFRGEKGYEIEKIIAEADMAVFADSSVLYYEPRMERFRENVNSLQNRLSQISVEEQAEEYFAHGRSDIGILWDTLQKAEESREEGLWHWRSREFNSSVLSYINQVVSRDADKTIVVLSSNDGILGEIYKGSYIQAHRKNDNGKSITIINFAKGNRMNRLPVAGDARISYSLPEFYKTSLDMDEAASFLGAEDVEMALYLEDGAFHSCCTAYMEDAEGADKGWQDTCEKWLKWQLEIFPSDFNVIQKYFSDLWVNFWSEEVRSVPAALMVRKLCQGGYITTHYKEEQAEKKSKMLSEECDCMEAVKIQEIFCFADTKAVMDSESARQFCDRFEPEMLGRILECDRQEGILDEWEKQKLCDLQKQLN